jgi:hypothetical protein
MLSATTFSSQPPQPERVTFASARPSDTWRQSEGKRTADLAGSANRDNGIDDVGHLFGDVIPDVATNDQVRSR